MLEVASSMYLIQIRKILKEENMKFGIFYWANS